MIFKLRVNTNLLCLEHYIKRSEITDNWSSVAADILLLCSNQLLYNMIYKLQVLEENVEMFSKLLSKSNSHCYN